MPLKVAQGAQMLAKDIHERLHLRQKERQKHGEAEKLA